MADENVTGQVGFDYYINTYNATGTLTATDFAITGEGSEKFGIVKNAEFDRFQLVKAEGASFDFETKESYDLDIIFDDNNSDVTDDSNVIKATVNINNLFDYIQGTAGTALVENTSIAQTAVLYTAAADINGVTWGLSGTDADKFNINAAGEVTFKNDTTPDYEKQSSYSFEVVATNQFNSSTSQTTVILDVVDDLRIDAFHLTSTYPVESNIAPDATVTASTAIANSNFTRLTDGHEGESQFSTPVEQSSLSYVVRNADGATLTFDFGNDVYTDGSFVLYNRVSTKAEWVERINGSKVEFILGEDTVGTRTLLTSNPDHDGKNNTIYVALDAGQEFDKVVLTFESLDPDNDTDQTQNFSEIKISGT